MRVTQAFLGYFVDHNMGIVHNILQLYTSQWIQLWRDI